MDKKKKMNWMGIASIVASLALMVYEKYQALPNDTLLARLGTGVLTYITIAFSAIVIVLILWVGMYLANVFLNTIFDDDREPPSWDYSDRMMLFVFAVLYVLQLVGKDFAIIKL